MIRNYIFSSIAHRSHIALYTVVALRIFAHRQPTMANMASSTAAVAPEQRHSPIRVAIVVVGAGSPQGQTVRGLLPKFGLEGCRNIDLSADFKLTGAEIASCLNSNSESMIVQRAIIGHEDFVGTMSTCFDQSSREPPNGTRVEFRTCNGPQSEVVGRMEAAALNFLKCTVAGSQEGPLFHAQLFSLHEVPVDKIEEKLAEAVAWATDPVIDSGCGASHMVRSIDRPVSNIAMATEQRWQKTPSMMRRWPLLQPTGMRGNRSSSRSSSHQPCRWMVPKLISRIWQAHDDRDWATSAHQGCLYRHPPYVGS